MNSRDAAAEVLAQAEEPLHYREITRRMLAQGLWESEGKTPWNTANAALAVDIDRRGSDSRFQRTEPGVFALRSWGLPEHEVARKKKEAEDAPDAPATMTFNDAAEYVLDKFGRREPMHYRAITDKVLELGLVHTEGKTPEATLYAQILTEIDRHKKRGETPRFVKHGKGYVGLRKWMGYGLAFQIQRHNAGVRRQLHARLHKMDPAEFEGVIGQLLVALGFEEVVVTSVSNDGGIDVRGTLVVGDVIKTQMAVQVKRWQGNVQAPTVQQVRGSLGTHEQGLIITTSDFSKGARVEAERADAIPVALMDGEQLVQLLIENDIGVHRNRYDLIELGAGEDR